MPEKIDPLDLVRAGYSMWHADMPEGWVDRNLRERCVEVGSIEEANLLSSRGPNGLKLHQIAIDLDKPHFYVPSSTEGHAHLYITGRISWWRYVILLWALNLCGVIEKGYFVASLTRKMTMLRLPGAKKNLTPLPSYDDY